MEERKLGGRVDVDDAGGGRGRHMSNTGRGSEGGEGGGGGGFDWLAG